jgi:LysM repeat protein
MKKPRLLLVILFSCLGSFAQNLSVQEYIEKYKDIAIQEMKRMGIPASITLAQGILETENGNSILVKKSNNHFGIKCKSNWTGQTVSHDDDASGECFRKYDKPEDSYRDHSEFLRNSTRYASLFQLEPTDYKGWAYGLKKCGYATNPRYPEILISNIERYNLQQYNVQTLDEQPMKDPLMVSEAHNQEKMNVKQPATQTVGVTQVFHKQEKAFFNSLRAVFVNKGVSLLAVATAYDISLTKLLEYNDLRTDGLLQEGQWIYLEKKAKQGNRDYYVALDNESLYDISQNNGIQLSQLASYNNLAETALVKKGTKLYLRPGLAINSTNTKN